MTTNVFGTGRQDLCLRVNGVKLPTGYYFGFSSATGADVSDNHDIVTIATYEIQSEDFGVHRVHASRDGIIPWAPKPGTQNDTDNAWSLIRMIFALSAVVILGLFAYSLVAFSSIKPKRT